MNRIHYGIELEMEYSLSRTNLFIKKEFIVKYTK